MFLTIIIGLIVYGFSAILLNWLVSISPQAKDQDSSWAFSLYIQATSIGGQVLSAFVPVLGPVVLIALIVNWFVACHMMIETPWWYSMILGVGYIIVWIICVVVFSTLLAMGMVAIFSLFAFL